MRAASRIANHFHFTTYPVLDEVPFALVTSIIKPVHSAPGFSSGIQQGKMIQTRTAVETFLVIFTSGFFHELQPYHVAKLGLP